MSFYVASASSASVASRLAALEAKDLPAKVKMLEEQVAYLLEQRDILDAKIGQHQNLIDWLDNRVTALEAWSHPPGT
jgi:hypothetical protein